MSRSFSELKRVSQDGFAYVNVDEIPFEIRGKFEKWLYGATQPILEPPDIGRFNGAAYWWDFQDFLSGIPNTD